MKDAKVDQKQFVYIEAILSSMTKYERAHPKVIGGNMRNMKQIMSKYQ